MRSGRRTAAAAILAVGLTLAGCSSPSPPIGGCAKAASEELFQNGMYKCPGGTVVFTFASADARDNWVKVATQSGVDVTDKGPNWVKVTGGIY